MINWLRLINILVWLAVVVVGPFITLRIEELALSFLPQILLNYLRGLFMMSVSLAVIVILIGSFQSVMYRYLRKGRQK